MIYLVSKGEDIDLTRFLQVNKNSKNERYCKQVLRDHNWGPRPENWDKYMTEVMDRRGLKFHVKEESAFVTEDETLKKLKQLQQQERKCNSTNGNFMHMARKDAWQCMIDIIAFFNIEHSDKLILEVLSMIGRSLESFAVLLESFRTIIREYRVDKSVTQSFFDDTTPPTTLAKYDELESIFNDIWDQTQQLLPNVLMLAKPANTMTNQALKNLHLSLQILSDKCYSMLPLRKYWYDLAKENRNGASGMF